MKTLVSLAGLLVFLVGLTAGLVLQRIGAEPDPTYSVERVEIGEFIDCIIVTVDDTVLMGPCVPKDWR